MAGLTHAGTLSERGKRRGKSKNTTPKEKIFCDTLTSRASGECRVHAVYPSLARQERTRHKKFFPEWAGDFWIFGVGLFTSRSVPFSIPPTYQVVLVALLPQEKSY